MVDALKVTWQSVKDLWDEFVILIMLNVVWSLSILLALAPQLLLGSANLGLALGLSLLLSIPIPIVSGALCFVTNQVAHERAVGWDTFVSGLRLYWRKSLAVALINLVVLILIVANLQFYAVYLEGTWTNFAVAAWILLGIYWYIAQIYWFPMILELESEKVLLALRNALSLVLVSPGFSIVLAIILLIITILCIGLTIPLPLFMAVLLLLIINRATINRITVIREKHEARSEEE
ncbi:MAG: hypothetical protein PVF77_09265 [Anaerolineae bacterium]|jgi:hypothetical protein